MTRIEWENMSWRDRFNLLKGILCIGTDSSLATYLGVSRSALCMIMSGHRSPSEKLRRTMEDIAVVKEDIKKLQTNFVGFNTSSVDGASDLYQAALDNRNPITLHMACHSLAVKLAHVLTVDTDTSLIATISATYGGFPATVYVDIADPLHRGLHARVTITHTDEGEMMFTVGLSIYLKKVVVREYGYRCNDRALVDVCNRYINFRNSLKQPKKKHGRS